MISKLKKILLCFLSFAFLLTGIIPVSAENSGEAGDLIDGIIAYQQSNCNAPTVQAWIDGALTKNAGVSSEWYVIALSQYGEYDFSSYEKALLDYLDNNTVQSASSRQKYALALVACGSTDEYIYNVLNNSIGKQGIMSRIFGLHLLNNGYNSNTNPISEVKQGILFLQLGDGGWAVSGSKSDVDVTAMAVGALAPHYKTDSAVKNAVDKAVSLLSGRQGENGDYASYGVSCSESTAQVLTALSALGIDCKTDSRFIKNGNTIFDGLALYRLSDGSFCHKEGGTYNANATAQAFYSAVAYLRMKDGQSPLFVLDARNPSGLKAPAAEISSSSESSSLASSDVNSSGSESITQSAQSKIDSTVQSTESIASDNQETETYNSAIAETADETEVTTDTFESTKSGGGYKLWACLAVIIAAGAACVILCCLKKRNLRNFAVIGISTAAAVAFLLVTDFQSVDGYYKADKGKTDIIGTVSITICCDTVPDKSAEHIPDNGTILENYKLEIEEGDTVLEVLNEATAKNKIHLETNGAGDSAYVEGINNIYEFDFGDLSGWMYFVNGELPSVGCGKYALSDGDKIEWLYTCDMGNDIERG